MSWEVTNSWQDVETELSTNRIALADLRVVLQSRGFDNKLDYATGSEMLLPHLRPTRNLSRWYVASVQLSLRQGNNAEALMDMLASLRLTRVPENDRLVVCELTRIQIANQNAAVCWEALQSDNWTDGQLAEIQSGWLHTSFLTNMILALKMKRAIYRSDFKRFLNSAGSGSAVGALMFHVTPPWVEMMPDGIEVAFTQRIAPAFWRFAWLKQDEKNLLEAVEALIQTCQSAATNQSKLQVSPLLDQFSEKYLPQECRSTIFPVSELILSGIFAPIGAVFRAETQRSLVLCAIALKRHSLRHGKLPTTLDALVPEFLSSVPVDFMDGKPVKYRLGSDGSFTLYSIGEDGMDDGGDIFPVATYSWRDLWKRRDYVWSAPATSAEIEVARKEKRF